MRKGGIGGTNTKTGLIFEGQTDLATFLKMQSGYSVDSEVKNQHNIFYNGELVGQVFIKHGLYKYLELKGIDWKEILSRQLLPDDSIFVIVNNTFFVIEKKFQQTEGSVDEKLQTCDFKRKQYQKLLSRLNVQVEYMYLLGDWFKHPKYKDSLDYVISMNCTYYFEYIPLKQLGLPVPKTEGIN